MGPFDEHINMHREVGQVDLMVCALEQSMIIESYNMDFRKYAKQTEYYMKNMSGEIITEALVDVGKKFMEMLEKLRKAIINFCVRAKDRIYQCVNGYRAFANKFNDTIFDNLDKFKSFKIKLLLYDMDKMNEYPKDITGQIEKDVQYALQDSVSYEDVKTILSGSKLDKLLGDMLNQSPITPNEFNPACVKFFEIEKDDYKTEIFDRTTILEMNKDLDKAESKIKQIETVQKRTANLLEGLKLKVRAVEKQNENDYEAIKKISVISNYLTKAMNKYMFALSCKVNYFTRVAKFNASVVTTAYNRAKKGDGMYEN